VQRPRERSAIVNAHGRHTAGRRPELESDEAGRAAAGAGTDAESGLLGKYPANRPITAFDGADLRQLFRAAYAWLERHHEEVNRLHVFPVPDGDTGTNGAPDAGNASASG